MKILQELVITFFICAFHYENYSIIRLCFYYNNNSDLIFTNQISYENRDFILVEGKNTSKLKLRPVPVLLGLVRFGSDLGWILFRISKNIWLWFGSGFCDYLSVWFCFVSTEPENHFSKILQLFSKNFFFKFLKSMKIQ